MLRVIAITVEAVDQRGGEIRWVNAMTCVLPCWHLIPNLYGADRGEEGWFRCRRGMHEGVAALQIVDGIASFSVTASRDGVTIIDIR